jgi:hypothetical protein
MPIAGLLQINSIQLMLIIEYQLEINLLFRASISN